jgi:hypothetical protein
MYLAIDNRPLIRQPHTIEYQVDEPAAGVSADGRPWARPQLGFVTLVCTWGREASYQDVLGELDRRRANRGVHGVTFEEPASHRRMTVNAYMAEPRVTAFGYDTRCKIAVSAFSVSFIQVDTPTYLYRLDFLLPGILAVQDAISSHVAPGAGRIVAVDGWITDLGSGTGQTRIQISNGATDYLATRGDFVCGVSRQMANQVLGTDLDFAGGDQIDIDVDAIPSGGLSAEARISVWARIYRP